MGTERSCPGGHGGAGTQCAAPLSTCVERCWSWSGARPGAMLTVGQCLLWPWESRWSAIADSWGAAPHKPGTAAGPGARTGAALAVRVMGDWGSHLRDLLFWLWLELCQPFHFLFGWFCCFSFLKNTFLNAMYLLQ